MYTTDRKERSVYKLKVNQNINIFAGADTAPGSAVNAFGFKNRNSAPATVNFLNQNIDPIAQKRAMAQKKAYKVVSDTFATEKKMDDDLKARADRIDQLHAQIAAAKREIQSLDEEEEQLREQYNVDPDSQEQKDLELLKQYQRFKAHRPNHLSKEEIERAAELEKQGITEYQERVLKKDSYKYSFEDEISKAQGEVYKESATIRATKSERLKHHAMLDAVKEAESILEAANDETIGMLIDEAKDHIDEEQEEELEEAKEKKEEEKEEEEKQEIAKERKEMMEALADPEKAEEYQHKHKEREALDTAPMTEQLVRMDQVKSDVQQEVADIVTQMKLVVEDVKGIKVDEQV